MDFAALPPEVNSARMYTGAGAGPLADAAASWSQIAEGLEWTAAQYNTTIADLTAVWTGPSSSAMTQTLTSYVSWLRSTAFLAQSTASAASAAAAAYETAYSATVPPPVIAANRSLLSVLVATNLFGQNFPAIAATEMHYMDMWAQDATAMIGYHGASSAATAALPVFPPAPAATNPAVALGGILDPTSFVGVTFQSILQSGTFYVLPISLLTLLVANRAVQQTDQQMATGTAPLEIPSVTTGPDIVPAIIAPAQENSVIAASYRASMGDAGRLGGWSVPARAVQLVASGGAVRPLAEISDMPTIIPPPLMSMAPKTAGDKGSNKPKTGREITGTVMPRPPAGG